MTLMQYRPPPKCVFINHNDHFIRRTVDVETKTKKRALSYR